MALSAEHKRKMQEGRERAQRKRDERAVERVLEYRAWLRKDTQYGSKERALEAVGKTPKQIKAELGKRPRIKEVPSDQDYDRARVAGAI